ncbi:TPA: mechanosensitive ion channel protein MscS [Pseudomonas putida]|nr:mechanosensitive ion channel protein MscS [Pseudomonas putida]
MQKQTCKASALFSAYSQRCFYCFTTTTVWADYERIQGDIFDYLLAVLPEFGLSLYQQPSRNDMRVGLAGRSAQEPLPRRLEEMSEA